MTRQNCINKYCKSCIYDKSQRGTWRQQVEKCHIVDCPLWVYRPTSSVSLKTTVIVQHSSDTGAIGADIQHNSGK